MSPPLDESEVAAFLARFTEEITDYDCGDLCRGDNNGQPYCCSAEHALPLLHEAELQLLNKTGGNWRRWVPSSERDEAVACQTPPGQTFCRCDRTVACSRSTRSIACRAFPLEPYVDEHGVFVGLTFMREFTWRDPRTGRPRCPLAGRAQDIRPEYIDEACAFWSRLMERMPEERRLYERTSERLRREFDRTGRRIQILRPSAAVQEMVC